MQAAHGHIDLFRLHVLAVQLPALKGPLVAVHGDFIYHRDLHGDLVLHGVGSLIGRQGTHDFIGHAVVIAVGHAVGDGFISDIYIGPAFDRGICTNCMVLPFIPIPVIPFRMGVTRLIQRNVVRFQISLQRAAMESLAHEDILRASLVVVINRLYSYLLIVIDHGDDVGPAIDGDGFQAVRGVSGILLVAVPGAIVIPTVKFILAGGIGCVVVADIQLAQVDDSALGLFVKFHGLVGRLKVAIAVDHHIDHLLGLPLGPQGDVLLNSIGEVILFIAQIPTVEGIAGLRGSGSRLGRGEAVFHFLVGRNGRTAVRIKGDGILVDVPLRCQGDVLCDGSTKVIRGGVLLVFAQIPEGKGMALERRVVRLGRGEAVFHFLLGRNGRAAVGIKGDGILVDVPLRRQGDVACDRGIKVIRGGLLLVFAQIPERKGIALERRGDRQDSLLAALDVLLIGRRETAVSVEGNGIFLRHIYAALRLDLPAVPVPDQRDRNDLLIVLDMFRGRERLVELGHIGVGDIADVAKPVVPVLPRLVADEVVFIVLAEQTVGVNMLLRITYDALDLNSHFKLFQLVSRRGCGRGLGGSRLCVLYLDFSFTAVQTPLFILVADHKIQRCLARIVELMRLRFFAVVLCDIRRGLDAYVVCPRLILSRRFRPVERLALRVVDQVVAFRPAVGLADVLYLNLPDNGFQIAIGGRNGFVRRRRVVLLPDGVDGLGAVCMFNGNIAARLILRLGRSRTVSPALEGVACLGRGLIGNGKGNLVHRWSRCRTRLTIRRTDAAIRIIPQFKGWHPDRVDGPGRIVLGQRNLFAAEVLRSRSILLVSPTNEGVAVTSRLAFVDVELVAFRRCGCRNIPARTTNVVKLVNQMVGVLGGGRVGILCHQINGSSFVAGRRPTHVEIPRLRVRIRFLAPAHNLVARVHGSTASRRLDVADGDGVIVVRRVAVIGLILADKLGLF